MTRVLNDNVWVDGALYLVGSTPPAEVAAQIGEHAWVEVGGPDPVTATPEASVAVVGGGELAATARTSPPARTTVPGAAPTLMRVSPPPMQGKGSNIQAWTSFAESHGVRVEESWTRSEIIDAVVAAGIPTAE